MALWKSCNIDILRCLKSHDSWLRRKFKNRAPTSCRLGPISHVCAVAPYAVLEANGKVNGIREISHPSTSPTLGPIWMPLQIYHYVPPGVDVQNLIKIDSAVAALRMREKTRFRVGFFCLHIRLSIYRGCQSRWQPIRFNRSQNTNF